MTRAEVLSAALCGPRAVEVKVVAEEVPRSLAELVIIGVQPAVSIELRTRVRSAILNSGFALPGRLHVTVEPARTVKQPALLDLPIALAALVASGQLPPEAVAGVVAVGELSLDGRIRSVRGAYGVARWADAQGLAFAGPAESRDEVTAAGARALLCPTLRELVEVLRSRSEEDPLASFPRLAPPRGYAQASLDLADIRGMPRTRRALEVAAASGMGLLLIGCPGAGKTMAARRLTTILPDLTPEEGSEVLSTFSSAGLLPDGFSSAGFRPFRAPHHSVSEAAMTGARGRPGELALAHQGVLYLDDAPEFRSRVKPLVEAACLHGEVRGVGEQVSWPARFQLVASANPCPCGYLGHSAHGITCVCRPESVAGYRRYLEPLLGALPLRVRMDPPGREEARELPPGESSAVVRARVEAARRRWDARGDIDGPGAPLTLSTEAEAVLEASGRYSFDALIARCVASVIADLAGADRVEREDVEEAIGLTRPIEEL